jgi:hypothetical protein
MGMETSPRFGASQLFPTDFRLARAVPNYLRYPYTRLGDEDSFIRIPPREDDVEANATRPG